jgi:hypothetical protein
VKLSIRTKRVFVLGIVLFLFVVAEKAHSSREGGIEFPCKDSALVLPYIKTKYKLNVNDQLCEAVETKPKKPLFWFSTVRLNSINGISIGAGITDPNDCAEGVISGVSMSPIGIKLVGGYIYHSGFDGPKSVDYSHYLFPFIAGAVKASVIQRWSTPKSNHEVVFGRGSEYSYFGYSGTIHFMYATFELGQYHPLFGGSKHVVASYGIGF